jgi:hypothetical protein
MGWALQIKDWLGLKEYRKLPHDEVAELFGKQYGLKPVEKKDMVLGKEYIALRITSDDFHFMRRNASGHWTHKQGEWEVTTVSQKTVFAKEWERWAGNYGGKIWLFEV